MKSERQESATQDKPKEKHPETHTNQTNRAETQRKNIKST